MNDRRTAGRRTEWRCAALVPVLALWFQILSACAGGLPHGTADRDPAQVVGRVTFVPGWDWSLLPHPDSAYFRPRPLAGVRVSLRSCPGRTDSVGVEVAATFTDSLGEYRLHAAPGDYCLLLHAARHSGVLASPALFPPDSEVSDFRRVRLHPQATLVHPFEVHELVPQ